MHRSLIKKTAYILIEILKIKYLILYLDQPSVVDYLRIVMGKNIFLPMTLSLVKKDHVIAKRNWKREVFLKWTRQ